MAGFSYQRDKAEHSNIIPWPHLVMFGVVRSGEMAIRWKKQVTSRNKEATEGVKMWDEVGILDHIGQQRGRGWPCHVHVEEK